MDIKSDHKWHGPKPEFAFEEASDEEVSDHQENGPTSNVEQNVLNGESHGPKPEFAFEEASAGPENGRETSEPAPAIIKMSGSNVGAEEAQDKIQAQDDIQTMIQDAARKFNEQVSAFNGFAERIKKLGKVEKDRFNALANNEVASASEDKTEKVPTLEDKANPTALSEDFREKCEEEGLGLETTAWTDENNNINFKITKVKEDRADLEDFKDYIVSISGLKNNEALIDFVSAVRVVGFEAAVKYMNELDKNNKVELVLLDKEGKKIEGEELDEFKRLTVPESQLKDSSISNEEQHLPTSYLNFIKKKPNIASNSAIGEEDSDIGRKSTSASQNDFEMLDSVSSAEAEVGMKLEKPQPRRMIVVGTTN